MKLSVKTLKGIRFEIDVSLDDKISDVKKNIENTQGRTVYPADQQMLIYQGKVLSDDTVLNDHNVSEGSFMVVMLKKAPVSSSGASTTTRTSASTAPTAISAPANPSTPLSAQAVTPPTTLSSVPSTTPTTAPENAPPGFAVSAPVPSTTPAPAPGVGAPVPSTTPAPAPGVGAPTEGDVYGQAASNLVAGSNFEGTVQQILEMGGGSWDRETVIRALRAAFNNPERAVDYLYSGIPAQAEAPAATQSPAIGQPVNPIVPVTQPSQPIVPTTGPNATGTPTSGPNANPLNLFGPNPTGIPTSGPNANPLNLFPQGLPNLGANAGGNLDFLRDSPQFRTLQTMVQANPQILQPMLQELAKQNPQILRLIQEHQSEFLGMINEPVEGGDSNLLNQLAAALPQQQQITVTPEEHEAIERLEAMGFDRNLVLQVFFACNKNEELAANYLLDHMNEFDE